MILAQQRRCDVLAASLLLGGTLAATFFNYFLKQGFWSPTLSHSALIALVVIQPFYLVQLYYMSRGRRWAKILHLALTGLVLAVLVFDFKTATKHLTSPGATLNFMFQQLIALIAAVLVTLTLEKPTPEPVEDEELY